MCVFSILSSVSEILFSISCILLVKLASQVPVQVPKFSFPDSTQFSLLIQVVFIDSISIFRS